MAKKILVAGGALAASSYCLPRIGDFVVHGGDEADGMRSAQASSG